MTPYPLTLQVGMKRFQGHLFIAPTKLYFVCGKKGGVWLQAIGQGVGGLIGGAIAAAAQGSPGEAPTAVDENALARAVAENEGSLTMEPGQIDEIKETWFMRLIRLNGKTFGLPNGLGKPLKVALGPWAKQNNVKTKGLG